MGECDEGAQAVRHHDARRVLSDGPGDDCAYLTAELGEHEVRSDVGKQQEQAEAAGRPTASDRSRDGVHSASPRRGQQCGHTIRVALARREFLRDPRPPRGLGRSGRRVRVRRRGPSGRRTPQGSDSRPPQGRTVGAVGSPPPHEARSTVRRSREPSARPVAVLDRGPTVCRGYRRRAGSRGQVCPMPAEHDDVAGCGQRTSGRSAGPSGRARTISRTISTHSMHTAANRAPRVMK